MGNKADVSKEAEGAVLQVSATVSEAEVFIAAGGKLETADAQKLAKISIDTSYRLQTNRLKLEQLGGKYGPEYDKLLSLDVSDDGIIEQLGIVRSMKKEAALIEGRIEYLSDVWQKIKEIQSDRQAEQDNQRESRSASYSSVASRDPKLSAEHLPV
jgi:hypothetical protein